MKREHIARDYEYGPPCAAPAHFPYDHPTVAEVDRWENVKRGRSKVANEAKRLRRNKT